MMAAAAGRAEGWLDAAGVLWVDGRAAGPTACHHQMDVVDLAVELANFSAEAGELNCCATPPLCQDAVHCHLKKASFTIRLAYFSCWPFARGLKSHTTASCALPHTCSCAERDASGVGGAVDRKPHKQRMSADFGGRLDTGAAAGLPPNSRLGGKQTQAMLTGSGPGATGLRRRWEMLDAAVAATCGGSQLIQMFCVVCTGQGEGTVTGEPHADAQVRPLPPRPPPAVEPAIADGMAAQHGVSVAALRPDWPLSNRGAAPPTSVAIG